MNAPSIFNFKELLDCYCNNFLYIKPLFYYNMGDLQLLYEATDSQNKNALFILPWENIISSYLSLIDLAILSLAT